MRRAVRARHRDQPVDVLRVVNGEPSARQVRDAQVSELIRAERDSGRLVAGLGSRKMWLRLRGKGHEVARSHRGTAVPGQRVGRCRDGKLSRTTIPDPTADQAGDLVHREFDPVAPNRLWVADFTYCPTWLGMVYVAFVIDAFSRRVIGWRAARSMTTPLVLDALEHAMFTRAQEGVTDLSGLVGALRCRVARQHRVNLRPALTLAPTRRRGRGRPACTDGGSLTGLDADPSSSWCVADGQHGMLPSYERRDQFGGCWRRC